MHPLRLALLTTLLILPSRGATAQVFDGREPRVRDQWVFGGSLFAGIPVGEFRNHENGGAGGEVVIGFQPWRREPLILRGNVGSLVYGTVNGRAYQRVCQGFSCWTEEVSYNARNHTMTFLQGGPEIAATDGTWRPFAFAMAGVTFFSSKANLLPSSPNEPAPPSQNLFSSNNFSTAYGAGVRRVKSQFGRGGGFELAFRVTRNAKASYLTEEGLNRNPDGTWDVSPRSGAANVLGVHLGFWVGPYVSWTDRR